MKFKLIKNCKTCEFNFNGYCCGHSDAYGYDKKIERNIQNCNQWGISFEHFTELQKNAPWYIVDKFNWHKISFNKFMELAEKEYSNKKIDINIYDAIFKIYKISISQLSKVLDVPEGVIIYAKQRGTPKKRVYNFSKKLCIQEELFYNFTNKDLPKLEECYNKYICKIK